MIFNKITSAWICISLFAITSMSCSKFESEISLGEYRITYNVVTESDNWFGKFIGEEGEVCLCEAPFQPSDWSYTFTTNRIPSKLQIEATSELFDETKMTDFPDITVSIYINGELKDIQTNSIADGKTLATYPGESEIF